MRATPLAVLMSLALLVAAAPAGADSKEEAKRHFDRALELVDEGGFEEAVIEFKRAYDLTPHYMVLFNLGQAYVGLGSPVEAVDTLKRYLEEGGDRIQPDRRAAVEAEIKRQQARIARLTITAKPDGGTVWVDEKEAGVTPLTAPVRVGIGRHVVLVRREGYLPSEKRITVAGEEKRSLHFDLKPVQTAPVVVAPARLEIHCRIPDVQVFSGQSLIGVTPMREPSTLPAGSHQIVFRRRGYGDKTLNLLLGPGAHESVDCDLEQLTLLPAGVAATLSVKPSEPEADIEVDGRPFGGVGPVPVGRHTVLVGRAGFEPWGQDVQLAAGETLQVEAQLVPEDSFRDEYRTSAMNQRVWAYVTAGAGVAVGLTAMGLYFWNDGRYSDWEDEQATLDEEWEQPTILNEEDVDQRQRDNDERLGSIQKMDGVVVGMGITGGALLATGAVLLLTGDDPNRYEVGVAADRRGGFVGLGGRF